MPNEQDQKFLDWIVDFKDEELIMVLNYREEQLIRSPLDMSNFHSVFETFLIEAREEFDEHYAESEATNL